MGGAAGPVGGTRGCRLSPAPAGRHPAALLRAAVAPPARPRPAAPRGARSAWRGRRRAGTTKGRGVGTGGRRREQWGAAAAPWRHLPPVPSEFSLRLPEESCWAPTHPPMGPRPPPQGARPGRRLSLLRRRRLGPGAALSPPSLRPLAAPPTASPGPFLRAHLYLNPRAAQPAGPARVQPSAPARPRQAGLDPSRAGRSARLPLAFPRPPRLGETRRRRPAARPHRPRPRRRPQPGSACARPARLERPRGAELRADWLKAPRGRGVPNRTERSREPEAGRVGDEWRWAGKKGRTQVRTKWPSRRWGS